MRNANRSAEAVLGLALEGRRRPEFGVGQVASRAVGILSQRLVRAGEFSASSSAHGWSFTVACRDNSRGNGAGFTLLYGCWKTLQNPPLSAMIRDGQRLSKGDLIVP